MRFEFFYFFSRYENLTPELYSLELTPNNQTIDCLPTYAANACSVGLANPILRAQIIIRLTLSTYYSLLNSHETRFYDKKLSIGAQDWQK